ncbi:MAG: 30S ribosomal protein S16 [Rikenellaceae bacterium]
MAVKIRLARHGKKNYAFYHIVVADGRAPRDGKFIEKIGTYNPNTNPASITLEFEKALGWLNKGAQPTDTVRTILSNEGVLVMKHLEGGVRKGAFTDEVAKERFAAWKTAKTAKVDTAIKSLDSAKSKEAAARLERESQIKAAKAEVVAAKKAVIEAAKKAAEAEAAAQTAAEEPATEPAAAAEVAAE